MAVNTSTASELTADQVASILVKPLEAASMFLASGPIIYDTTGPFRLPKAPANAGYDAAPAGGETPDTDIPFTGESQPIPEADPDFDEITLLPSTMQSVKVITRFSNELARSSVVSLEAALRERLVRSVAARLDAQFFGDSGDGISTPQGMFAWAGVQTSAVGAAIDLDVILTAQGLALAADVDPARLRLFLRPEQYMALRELKISATDNRYVLQPDAQLGGLGTIPVLGMPTVVTNRIPAGYAAIADMSQVAVARDMAPSVTILSERYADYDEQAVRVVARYDVKPVNPAAVVTLTGIT